MTMLTGARCHLKGVTPSLQNQIADLTYENEKLKKEREWLDIADAPKEVTRMIAIDEEGVIEVIEYGENWCSHGCYVPTHWMHLPKPPHHAEKPDEPERLECWAVDHGLIATSFFSDYQAALSYGVAYGKKPIHLVEQPTEEEAYASLYDDGWGNEQARTIVVSMKKMDMLKEGEDNG